MQTVKLFENQATFDFVSIYTGIAKINYLFGDNPDTDDYLDNALNCLRLIGNLHVGIANYSGTSDKDGKLCLPTMAFQIESVTRHVILDRTSGSMYSDPSNLYQPGPYIKYEYYGDYIIIEPETAVNVIYRTYYQDEDGLPLINEREAEACAYWWKWVDTRRKLYTGNTLAANIYQLVTRDKNKAINQARVPDKLSQNFLNQYMNVISSYDRKSYNLSAKLSKTA